MSIVFLRILIIPVETGQTACLRVSLQACLDLTSFQEVVDIKIIISTGQRHADVSEMIHHLLPGIAPFAGSSSSPWTQVAGHPLSKLIILTGTWFLRAPVYLRNKNRFIFYNRHLLLEIIDESVGIIVGITCPIPSRIYMHGIAEVAVGNRIRGIILILALIARARNPDNTLEAILANHINHWLEIISHGCGWTLTIPIIYMNRLVGKFQGYDAWIILHPTVAGNNVPHRFKIILISIAYLQILRTYAWRTNHHIQAMIDGLLRNRQIKGIKILLQTGSTETRYISLSSIRTRWLLVGIIGPAWFEMKTEDVTISAFSRILECSENLVVIANAWLNIVISTSITPTVFVEVRTRCIHHTMQNHFVAIGIIQLIAIHMKRRNHSKLGEQTWR